MLDSSDSDTEKLRLIAAVKQSSVSLNVTTQQAKPSNTRRSASFTVGVPASIPSSVTTATTAAPLVKVCNAK